MVGIPPRLGGVPWVAVDQLKASRGIRAICASHAAIGLIRPLVVAFVVAISLVALGLHWKGLSGFDMDQYWAAAMRIRADEPLYVAGAGDRVSHYRYTPWFAYAWIPLTFLDHAFVAAVWASAGFAASAAVVLDVARRGWAGIAVASFLGVELLWWVRGGNVQPLMIAALYFGVRTRAGPALVAAAATLKVAPILFVLVYIARREWRRAAWTLGLTALLSVPVLLHDLSGFGSGIDTASTNMSLFLISPVVWLTAAAGAAAAATWVAFVRPRDVGLASSIAAIAALPRLFMGDLTLLLVAIGIDGERLPRLNPGRRTESAGPGPRRGTARTIPRPGRFRARWERWAGRATR